MLQVQIIGNLVYDCQVKTFDGRQFFSFKVAVEGRTGKTYFVDVAMWSPNIKLQPYLTKGTKVFVQGHLEAHAYKKQTSEVEVSLGVNAQQLELCGTAKRTEPTPTTTPQTTEEESF